MAAFSGFYESHEAPPLGDVCSTVPSHRNSHRNSQPRRPILHRCFSCCLTVGCQGDTEQLIARWQHLVGGFYESPGPPPWGNAGGIAPSHRHGYRNGKRRRYIPSLLPPLLFDQNVARRPFYGPSKLTPSYYINLIGVVSLFVSYWLLPLTIDVILATIVAGGRAQY